MIKIVRKFLVAALFLLFVGAGGAYADSRDCRRELAAQIADTILTQTNPSEDVIIISSDMLKEFFVKNIDICRDYLLARQSPDEDIYIADPDLIVDINWDYLVEEVAAALSTTAEQRILFVCENDRSYQAGIDAVLWLGTIAAAVASFGTGGVAIQGAKTAVVQGTKSLVKTGAVKGAKQAAVKATAQRLGYDIAAKETAKVSAEAALKTAGKTTAAAQAQTAAVAAAKEASTKMANDAIIIQTKAALQSAGKKRVTDKMLQNEIRSKIATAGAGTDTSALTNALNLIDDKIAKNAAKRTAQAAVKAEVTAANDAVAAASAALTAETAAASKALATAMTKFAISTPLAAAGGFASVYSFLESGFNPTIMNCTDTDKNTGCYLSCSKDSLGTPIDDLNTKVFKPIFGKNLCIDEENNYVLREIQTGLPLPGDVFMTTQEKWAQAKSEIAAKVQNKGKCDWKLDDIDAYVATPLYDSSTLMPRDNGATGLIIDGIRIDE